MYDLNIKRAAVYFALSLVLLLPKKMWGQIAPSAYENIDYLMTFGQDSPKEWGDDDYTQVHFFVIPRNEKAPIYIRIYDPGTGSELDTKNNDFNTTCSFTLYGGKGTHSEAGAKNVDPVPGYDKGKVLKHKVFGNDQNYNKKWFTFGPINPSEGEFSEDFNGYVFKVICKGLSGDDGNAYRYALSYEKDRNVAIQNGNIFTYELSFRLKNNVLNTAHIYPFITDNIVSITQFNFDADTDVYMRLTSVARKLVPAAASADGKWNSSHYQIKEKEKNTTIDIQLTKKTEAGNDMVIYIKNQYNEAMPLFSTPIGGQPKYLYNVKVKYSF